LLNGFINIDKPSGISSYSVIRELKPYLGNSKLGFIGTLDPMASGVLPISIGFANRLSGEVNSDKKEYIAKGIFGTETDTYDSEGKVTGKANFDHIHQKDLEGILDFFMGENLQQAPIYSALKVKGRRMYDLARKGIDFEPKNRKVELFSAEVIDFDLPFYQIKILCGKGFYVRSLIHDIGKKLNSLSHMVGLRRTLSGPFSIESSVSIENAQNKLDKDLLKDLIIPAQDILNGFKIVNIDDFGVKKILTGTSIKLNMNYKENNKLAFLDGSNNLIAIGLLIDGMGVPKKVMKNV
tara:strand:+ start:3705 stop:4589 length:885 start_codon:yes stop_codon:yes gene_type:complete